MGPPPLVPLILVLVSSHCCSDFLSGILGNQICVCLVTLQILALVLLGCLFLFFSVPPRPQGGLGGIVTVTFRMTWTRLSLSVLVGHG